MDYYWEKVNIITDFFMSFFKKSQAKEKAIRFKNL